LHMACMTPGQPQAYACAECKGGQENSGKYIHVDL
jgi:hypothetical protein